MEENTNSKIEFLDRAHEIEAMVKTDQDMRNKKRISEDFFDETIGKNNAEKLKIIISEIGWPTISKVGEESSHSAWLLAQHAEHNIPFQLQCLELMKQCAPGEVSKKDIAYLEDRIRVNLGQPQIYGTQFTRQGEIYVPKPIENRDSVDDRRKEMNLETLEAGIIEMNK